MTPAPPTSDAASQASFTGMEEPLNGVPTHGVARGVVPCRLRPVDPEGRGALGAAIGPAGAMSLVAMTDLRAWSAAGCRRSSRCTVIDQAVPPLLVDGVPIEQWSAEPVFVKSPAVSPETGLSNRDHQRERRGARRALGRDDRHPRGRTPRRRHRRGWPRSRRHRTACGRIQQSPVTHRRALALGVLVRTAGGARVPLEAGVRPTKDHDGERRDAGGTTAGESNMTRRMTGCRVRRDARSCSSSFEASTTPELGGLVARRITRRRGPDLDPEACSCRCWRAGASAGGRTDRARRPSRRSAPSRRGPARGVLVIERHGECIGLGAAGHESPAARMQSPGSPGPVVGRSGTYGHVSLRVALHLPDGRRARRCDHRPACVP